jgi:hypothetical protein
MVLKTNIVIFAIFEIVCNAIFFISWQRMVLYLAKIHEQIIRWLVSIRYMIRFNHIFSKICGQKVYVVDFKPFFPQHYGFDSRQELWILSCKKAIQLAYRTSVVLLRCPFLDDRMHGWRDGHLRSSCTRKAGKSP